MFTFKLKQIASKEKAVDVEATPFQYDGVDDTIRRNKRSDDAENAIALGQNDDQEIKILETAPHSQYCKIEKKRSRNGMNRED